MRSTSRQHMAHDRVVHRCTHCRANTGTVFFCSEKDTCKLYSVSKCAFDCVWTQVHKLDPGFPAGACLQRDSAHVRFRRYRPHSTSHAVEEKKTYRPHETQFRLSSFISIQKSHLLPDSISCFSAKLFPIKNMERFS